MYDIINADIDFQGLIKSLDAYEKDLPKRVQSGFKKIGRQIPIDAYTKVPNDTGKLLRSYKYEATTEELEAGYDVVYADYQHRGRRRDGTHVIRNRPAGGETRFLEKTVNMKLDKYTEIIKNEVIK